MVRHRRLPLYLLAFLLAGLTSWATAQTLWQKVGSGTLEEVRGLLPEIHSRRVGINRYDQPEGWTFIHYVAHNNPDPDVITLLYEEGADLDIPVHEDNGTALHLALISNPNEQVALRLIQHGASLDATWMTTTDTAVDLAIARNRYEFLRALAASPDLYGVHAEQALTYIERLEDAEAQRTRREQETQLAAQQAREAQEAQRAAEQARIEERQAREAQEAAEKEREEREFFRLVGEAIADPTVIFRLINEQRYEELEGLYSANVFDAGIRDEYGQTPLMYAISTRNLLLAELVLSNSHESDVTARTDAGWTALHYIARDVNWRWTAEELVRMGVDAGARNSDGDTAADIASRKGKAELASYLRSPISTPAVSTPTVPVTQPASRSPEFCQTFTPIVQEVFGKVAALELVPQEGMQFTLGPARGRYATSTTNPLLALNMDLSNTLSMFQSRGFTVETFGSVVTESGLSIPEIVWIRLPIDYDLIIAVDFRYWRSSGIVGQCVMHGLKP